MITDTLLNGLKSLFSTLGAKTSDSNYAVGLYDKTSGEPKGLMDMPNLASVLGVGFSKAATVITSTTDIDDLVTAGNFYAWGSDYPSGTFPSDISDKRYFTLKIVDQNLPTQILTSATNGRVWQRVQNSGAWSSWYSSDSFGCSTPSALASLLGGVIGINVYSIGPTETGAPFPEGYNGIVLQFKGTANNTSGVIALCEVAFRGSSTDSESAVSVVKVRHKYAGYPYTAWQTVILAT